MLYLMTLFDEHGMVGRALFFSIDDALKWALPYEYEYSRTEKIRVISGLKKGEE